MKNIVALAVMLLIATPAFAVEKEAQHIYEGETYMEKIGVTGNQQTGNPGYIILQSVNWSNPAVTDTFYLWVDVSNRLLIASFATVSPFASFPTGDWRKPNFPVGTVVGSQS